MIKVSDIKIDSFMFSLQDFIALDVQQTISKLPFISMKSTAHSIYGQTTQLFQNKSQAILLKKLVKACFIPYYVHQKQQSIHHSIKSNENGPSFMKDRYTKPIVVHKSIRATSKAFVSKRLNYNVCEKLRKEINEGKAETQHIHRKMQSNDIQSAFKGRMTTKNSTRATTNRSTLESQPKRTLFKLPL